MRDTRVDGAIPVQAYLDPMTHMKLKFAAMRQNIPMTRLLCSVLVEASFRYDDNGYPIAGNGGEAGVMDSIDDPEMQAYIAQEQRAKGIAPKQGAMPVVATPNSGGVKRGLDAVEATPFEQLPAAVQKALGKTL